MTGPNPGHRLGPIMLPDEGDWMTSARCTGVDPDIMFPEGAHGRGAGRPRTAEDMYAPAKALCAVCPVREQCLDYALAWPVTSDKFGVFGGMNPAERRRIRSARRLQL